VRHTRDPNELLEILGNELGSVVGNDSRFSVGVPFFGPFQNDLDVSLRHLLAQIPMNQETAVAVQDAAQIVECSANVQVSNIGQLGINVFGADSPYAMAVNQMAEPRPNKAIRTIRAKLAFLILNEAEKATQFVYRAVTAISIG
jgi:hypothetical protein